MNFLKSLLQHRILLVCTSLGFAVASMLYFQKVPKKYKVTTTVSIQPQFFQVPLVRDFVPESYDGAELRSQREALILRSLSPEFIARIIDQYHLGGKKLAAEMSSSDVADVARQFEIIPLGATNFLVSFYWKDPEDAYKVMRDFLAQIKKTMSSERSKTLLRIHDAIQERLETLSVSGSEKSTAPGMLASRPDLLKQEISRTEDQINDLRKSYSDKHPKVAALNRKLDSLNRWLKAGSEPGAIAPQVRNENFSGEGIDESSKELFKDLLKKFHYLEVVIYLDQQNLDGFLSVLQEPFVPETAIWPKRPIFLLWGLIIGFLVGSMAILVMEGLKERQRRMLDILPEGHPSAPEPVA